MRRKFLAALTGFGIAGTAALATTFTLAGSAHGHGWVDSPVSRQAHCANGTVTDCGDIQWEPQSVEGPKGFPADGPADGQICSGGNERFAVLDDPRGGDWPTTPLGAGEEHTFTWSISAAHATTDFQYFVTKDGWDPSQPLTRADLEPEPFLTVPYDGQRPENTVTHQGTLPEGKSGHHVILAVWNVADTGNAFYACSDVTF